MKSRDMKKLVANSFCVLLAAVGMIAMFSCQHNETPPAPTSSAIDFTVDIASDSPAQAAVQSRAGAYVSKSVFALADSIGLWVVPYSATADGSTVLTDVRTEMRGVGNYLDNIRHNYQTAAPAKFNSVSTIFYPNAKAKVDLYSVYPYNASMSNRANNSMPDPKAFSFRVSQDQSTADSVIKSDIMTAFFGGAKDGANGSLSFRHRMSRVLVDFTIGARYSGKAVKSVKSVKVCGIPLVSTINITDTAAVPVIGSGLNKKEEIAAYKAIIPNGGTIEGQYVYEAIVTPTVQFAKNDVVVKIVLDVTDIGDIEFACRLAEPLTLVPKRQTTIKITLNDQSVIVIATAQIRAWDATPDVNISAIKPVRMNFTITDDASSRASDVKFARLAIDDTTYMATAALDGAVLRCTYLQPDHRVGNKLKSVNLFKEDQTTEVTFASATPAISELNIPGNPTEESYARIISTLKFD